jgi:hypothetical protein
LLVFYLLNQDLPLLHSLGVALGTCRTLPGVALPGHLLSRLLATLYAAELALCICVHKTPDCDERGAHAPGRLPRLLVVAGDAQTDLAVDFEAAGRGQEAEGWGTKRVLGRQDDAAVVEAARIARGRGRTTYCEVPFEQVGFLGLGMVVGRGRDGELRGFLYCGLSDGPPAAGGAWR